MRVGTGFVRIKVKFLKTTAVKNICGVRKFGQETILITQVGKQTGCYRCRSKGHIAKKCPNKNVKILTTYASKLRNDNNNNQDDLPENDDEEEEEDQFENDEGEDNKNENE